MLQQINPCNPDSILEALNNANLKYSQYLEAKQEYSKLIDDLLRVDKGFADGDTNRD